MIALMILSNSVERKHLYYLIDNNHTLSTKLNTCIHLDFKPRCMARFEKWMLENIYQKRDKKRDNKQQTTNTQKLEKKTRCLKTPPGY